MSWYHINIVFYNEVTRVEDKYMKNINNYNLKELDGFKNLSG